MGCLGDSGAAGEGFRSKFRGRQGDGPGELACVKRSTGVVSCGGQASSGDLTGNDDHGRPKGWSRGHLEVTDSRGWGWAPGEGPESQTHSLSLQASEIRVLGGHIKGDMGGFLMSPSAG